MAPTVDPPTMSDVRQRRIQTVAVVGAGAMGAMYASYFARAGFEVWLVASGARADRLRTDPVSVNGEILDAEVKDPGDGSAPRPADLVLVAVKQGQLATAIEEMAPYVGADTTLLSVLNGLDSEEILAARFGAERVPLCIALAMDAQREGREVRYRQSGRLVFGSDVPGAARHLRAVQEACDRAGLAWQTPDDMRHMMWWKFMVNVGINQPSAVLRAPYGAFRGDGPARSLMLALMDEVIAISRAEGVPLGPDDLALWEQVLAGQPADGWTSMHQDVAAGRPTEVDIFAGRVVASGARHGIATPYNQAMLWILRSLDSTD